MAKDQFFRKMDTNQDGVISKAEWTAYMVKESADVPEDEMEAVIGSFT